jgi:hypothetical protein
LIAASERSSMKIREVQRIRKRNGDGLELAKLALVLVRLDHVARFIVNANHCIM